MNLVLGYHGCDLTAARDLLSGSAFKRSEKPYDWLGSGTYFWENDVLRAFRWADSRRRQAPCVVGAVIDLGYCLDVTTQRGAQAVKAAHDSFLELARQTGLALPVNKPSASGKPEDLALRFLDRAVIDHLHQTMKRAASREFDTVRALFPEGQPLYEGAGFLQQTHVQVAVRTPACILGVFRVPDEQLRRLDLPAIYERLKLSVNSGE